MKIPGVTVAHSQKINMNLEEFQQQLFDCAPDLVRFSTALCCDVEAGEQLAYDGLQRAIEKRKFWNAKRNLKVWLLQIIHHLAADRHASSFPTADSNKQLPPVGGMDRALLMRLQASLQVMPFEQRSVYVLATLEKLSYKDIAAVVGTDIDSIIAHLHSARNQLRMACQASTMQKTTATNR